MAEVAVGDFVVFNYKKVWNSENLNDATYIHCGYVVSMSEQAVCVEFPKPFSDYEGESWSADIYSVMVIPDFLVKKKYKNAS